MNELLDVHERVRQTDGPRSVGTRDARFDQVDARFAQVDARFEYLESNLDVRFDSVRHEIVSAKHEILAAVRGEMIAAIGLQTRTMIFALIGSLVTLGTLAFALARFT